MRTYLLPLLLISGCNDYWYRDAPGWEPKTVTIERVSQDGLLAHCGPGTDTGCTLRFAELNHAQIYLGPKADNCTLRHELRHAAGWNHDQRVMHRADCG